MNDCPMKNCGCVYHAEEGRLCKNAEDFLAAVDSCRFTLTQAHGAQCDTHGRTCPRSHPELWGAKSLPT